ncbi:MAG: hypothetical protein HF314_05580 [Ignavibacteria bacterium]|jgi:hypothetical protein|nr:hypothetical protein [Ignavibacteria bacterium]MCU7515275.1 hypothetical protein [Ignavibacteria bacterium]
MGKTGIFNLIKYSALCILLFLSFLTGCKSPNEPAPASSEYFPLAVGNKWYYSTDGVSRTSDSFTLIDEITGTKTIDNKMYYEVISTDFVSYTISTFYYRFEGNKLLLRNEKGEKIVADFSLNLNDKAYWEENLWVTEKNDDIITFGSTPSMKDWGYAVTYKKGIGMIYSYSNNFGYKSKELVKSEIK